jgi:hypothetical protein
LLAVLYATTLFAGAALLFLVQPLVGKLLLPLVGGTPGVWNTCMVFFPERAAGRVPVRAPQHRAAGRPPAGAVPPAAVGRGGGVVQGGDRHDRPAGPVVPSVLPDDQDRRS